AGQREVQVALGGRRVVVRVLGPGERKDAEDLNGLRRRGIGREDDPVDPRVDRDAVPGLEPRDGTPTLECRGNTPKDETGEGQSDEPHFPHTPPFTPLDAGHAWIVRLLTVTSRAFFLVCSFATRDGDR